MTRYSESSAMLDDDIMQPRRLPVYVLIDTSGSMAGEPITALETGLQSLLSDLITDPQCLDTVWLSIIAFSNHAEQILPLTDLCEVELPPLKAEGATALGDALELLAECLDEEVRRMSETVKGDWRPITFLFTDGAPSDEWEDACDELRNSDRTTLVACGAGPEIDEGVLQRIGDKVIRLQDTQPGTLGVFMCWMSEAVTSTSHSLGTRATRDEVLPPLPDNPAVVLR
ncbi:MAG: VWA domain-containing protein [Planctomycetaceae bacterium]